MGANFQSTYMLVEIAYRLEDASILIGVLAMWWWFVRVDRKNRV